MFDLTLQKEVRKKYHAYQPAMGDRALNPLIPASSVRDGGDKAFMDAYGHTEE